MDILSTVYTGNALGVALLLTLILGNTSRLSGDRDLRTLIKIMFIAISGCVMDAVSYTVDGHSGFIYTVLIYVSNSWLYFANMLVGKLWVTFVIDHIKVTMEKRTRVFLNVLFYFAVACLIINIFYPIVFEIKDNVYDRKFLYFIFVLIAGLYMAESVVLHYRAKKRRGGYSLFSVYIFLVPVVIGIVIQSLFYGISVIWPSICIALAGVMSAMKNEIIFKDRLTGIYNRVYLEYVQKDLSLRKEAYVTGMMIDLNDFKSINDKFGHAAGDEALIIAADIFCKTIGDLGSVMRYAGDEFVILINTVDDDKVSSVIENLNRALKAFNDTQEKPYKLSISIGYAALDLKNQSMNDFMNTIDKKMYENKAAYYEARGNDRRKR